MATNLDGFEREVGVLMGDIDVTTAVSHDELNGTAGFQGSLALNASCWGTYRGKL